MFRLLLFCLALTLTPTRAEWREASRLSIAVPGAAAAVMGGQIYMLSGAAGTGLRKFFEVYEIAGDGWRPLTPPPIARLEFAVAAGDGRVYVSGGRVLKSGALSAELWAYIPESALWVRLPDMPRPRAQHAAFFSDGKLIVLGGRGVGARDVWVYHVATRRWGQLTRLPEASRQFGHAQAGDKIYLAGGLDAEGRDSRAVHVFDLRAARWQRLPDLPYAASGIALGVLRDGLHIVGGYSQMPPQARAAHYVLRGKNWRARPDVPQARHLMGYAATARQLFIMGGALGEGVFALFTASDQMHIFTLPDAR